MRLFYSIFILCFLGLVTFKASANDSKKVKRLLAKADRAYDNFIYTRAVDFYERALEEKETFDAQISMKIADSYRLMNKPVSAERWYTKVEGTGVMDDQDLMNYVQILLKNGKDEKAHEISRQIEHPDLEKLERLNAIEDVKKFYRDSLAYFIENMNINTSQSEFSPTFLDEGFVFVSNREKGGFIKQSTYGWDDTYFLDLYYAKVDDGRILEPEPMSKRINTIFHEGPAVFYDDGNKLIFTRNNFNLGEERTSVEGINKLKLYYTEKSKRGKWGKASTLPFNSDDYSVGHPSYDDASNTLYFASDMPGGEGNSDLYMVKNVNGNWQEPVNLGSEINTTEDELFPFIGEDNVLYFASEGHPGIGGLDVYKVKLNAKKKKIVNMGYPINTPQDDFAMIMDGNTGYLSSNRDGSLGYDDIYKVNIYRYDIEAQLVDEDTGESLGGGLIAIDTQEDEVLVETEQAGNVSFNVARGREVVFNATSPGYVPKEMVFTTLDIPLEDERYFVEVPLRKPNLKAQVIRIVNPGSRELLSNDKTLRFYEGSLEELKEELKEEYYEVEKIYSINTIYYDFDEAVIREDAVEGLDELVKVLERFDVNVELHGHTDSRGSKSYNDRLSKRRVASAKAYLLEHGVAEDRIKINAFGENQLVNNCDDGMDCGQGKHQSNRRTEVRLKLRK